MGMGMNMPMRPMMGYAPVMTPQSHWDAQFARHSEDTKGKAREIDSLEEAFNRASLASEAASTEKEAEGIKVDQEDELERYVIHVVEHARTHLRSYISVWKEIKDSGLSANAASLAEWEAQNNQLLNGERDELELGDIDEFQYGKDMEEAWRQLGSDHFDERRDLQFDNDGIPQLGGYEFGVQSSSSQLMDLALTQLPIQNAKTRTSLPHPLT